MNALEGRILVTGGAGFIGSALVWALNQRGCRDIVITDVLGTGEKWRNLVPLRFADYIEADTFRARWASDAGAFGGFSAIFHLGANSATTEMDASLLMHNNFGWTRDLAGWAIRTGTRFIYASSAATYGDGSRGMSDLDGDLHRLRPLNAYGYSKHLFDVHAQQHGWLDRLVGLKYFNVFGPNEDHKGGMRSLVHKAFEQIRATGSLKLFRSHHPDYRDGEQMRDFLYVKDAVDMTLHFADGGADVGGLFNIGSGEAHTWLDLAHAIFAAMDLEPRIEFIDMPAELQEKYQYFTRAEISKLQGSGYTRPAIPLADAVADCVRNHLIPGVRLGG